MKFFVKSAHILQYIDNCVNAIIDAAISENTVGQAYNVTNFLFLPFEFNQLILNVLLQINQFSWNYWQIPQISDDSGCISALEYIQKLSQELGIQQPIKSLPFWPAYAVAFVMEKIWTFCKIKSRPFLTRHAVFIFGRGQWYPNQKAKNDFGYKEVVEIEEGIRRSAAWLKNQEILQ